MSGETEADRRARYLRVNRYDQVAEWLDTIERFTAGNENDRTREYALSQMSWLDPVDPADPAHPDNMLDTIGRQLLESMTRYGIDPAPFASLRIIGTAHTDVTAQLNQYGDGSALIMVSDAVFVALNMFCRFTTIGIAPAVVPEVFKRLRYLRRASKRGSVFEDEDIISWILRYYLIGQRLEGSGGQIILFLNPREEQIFNALYASAIRFVIAHELAHRALRHSPERAGFGPGVEVPACSPDQRRELEADWLALRVVLDDWRRQIAGPANLVQDMEVFSVLGIVSSLLTLHTIEKAVFVRNGHTHPSAEVRGSQVLKMAHPFAASIVSLFLPSLQRIADRASTFDEMAALLDWPRIKAGPYDIDRDMPRDHVEFARYLDAAQCMPRNELLARLQRSGPAIANGSTCLRDGRLREGLRAWNLEEADIEAIVDPSQALTFHSLVEAVRDGWKRLPLTDPLRDDASIAAASLIVENLRADN
ncbi:hypothetical protein AB0K52_22565 [Glycomyces sp. NPDC049804]|uniref:hypothetical protein n=1 Tax=Glycomyces sp. NPDC049804 TaxID=3154363 RepID=UPI00343AFF3C